MQLVSLAGSLNNQNQAIVFILFSEQVDMEENGQLLKAEGSC